MRAKVEQSGVTVKLSIVDEVKEAGEKALILARPAVVENRNQLKPATVNSTKPSSQP